MKKENMLAAMMFGGQAGGGGLPSVTGADWGKMPVVDDTGEWSVQDLNTSPRYISFALLTTDGKTFIADPDFQCSNELILRAIDGGFEVRVEAFYDNNPYFEISLPPLKLVKAVLMSSYAAITQGLVIGSAFQIVVRNINPDMPQSPVDIIALGYESAIPEKKISLAITDPITYSGTADITQSDISSYISWGASFSFEVTVGQSLITFKATEIINNGTYSVGGVVYIAGMGLAYIETSGSTFTTTPLVSVSP